MRVLIAFDKFKDALTAPQACAIARETIARERPEWTTELCPLADGGEGFATILTASVDGTWHPLHVTGPRGAPCVSRFGLVDPQSLPAAARDRLELGHARTLAVVEMATASGLESLPAAERDPWQTDTRGTGEVIKAAIAAGADAILLGVGGSATNDLGIGALSQLGWIPLDANGSPLSDLAPVGWKDLVEFSTPSQSLPPVRIACDVANPLLGPRGATTVFGPQKGLRPEDRDALERAIARAATLLGEATGNPGHESTPGAGAAGGIAYGFLTATRAQLVPGFDLVEEWLGLGPKLESADLIITGEGCFDESSLEGKGPGAIVSRGITLGKPVWVFPGALRLAEAPAGSQIHPISPADLPLPDALRLAPQNLAATLRRILRG